MKIRRSHTLGLEEARDRIDHMAAKLGHHYSLTSSWNGDHVDVRGSGVSGKIVVAHEFVEAVIELGVPLMLMEGLIRAEIEAAMDEHFGPTLS